jgi:AcrR family transcriptional regulator
MQNLVKKETRTSQEAQSGLRDRKKRRTRQAIRAAAIELFTVQGVDATTVEQIATAADISPRTFFNYFDTKEQAVSLPYGLRNEVGIATQPKPKQVWTTIQGVCLALATALEADVDERATLLAGIRLCAHEPVLHDQASAQRGQLEQLLLSALPPTLNNRVMVNAASGAVWASLTHWAESNGEGSLIKRVTTSLDLIQPNPQS